MSYLSERIIGTCETKSDSVTKPGRLILVEREGRFGPGRSEFVVWWEETTADGVPVTPGRSSGFYTEDRGDAQREFIRRIRREAWYWSPPDEDGGAA